MRRAVDPRIALAARNNAEWCDAVTRSWGGQGRFEAEAWINPGAAPPFYPNAVTLVPIGHVPGTIAAAAKSDFAVKDSFHALDLSALGFVPLFDAMWIWRDPVPIKAEGAVTSRILRDAACLLRWEAGWRGGEPALDLFRPSLLQEQDHAFIAIEAEEQIVAGCVASRSAAAVGLSNLFGASEHHMDCLAAVQDFAPGLPVVGYEPDAALEAMKSLGFQEIGPLRVWHRETKSPAYPQLWPLN